MHAVLPDLSLALKEAFGMEYRCQYQVHSQGGAMVWKLMIMKYKLVPKHL